MLLAAQDVKKAVSALEHAVQSSPWSLTENYVSAVLEKKVVGSLALVGAGDPSGRGRGYSFTKDPRRVRPSTPHCTLLLASCTVIKRHGRTHLS